MLSFLILKLIITISLSQVTFLNSKMSLSQSDIFEIIFEQKRTRSRLWGKAGINDTVVGGIIEKHP